MIRLKLILPISVGDQKKKKLFKRKVLIIFIVIIPILLLKAINEYKDISPRVPYFGGIINPFNTIRQF